MIFNAWQIASSVVLFVGSTAMLVGLFTSYWNYYYLQFGYDGGTKHINTIGHRGLLWFCHDSNMEIINGAQTCISRFRNFEKGSFKNEMMAKTIGDSLNYKPWEMASLILMSLSAVFGFGALFVAPLCCHKCGIIHSGFVYLAALFAILGIGVYIGYQLNSAMSQQTQYFRFDKFGWSFGVAIVGVIFQLLAAALYTVAACCCRSDGYERGSKV